MARKRSTKPMPAATETKTKPVRVDLAPDVHQQFRVEAAKEGISMAAMAKRSVDDWVAKIQEEVAMATIAMIRDAMHRAPFQGFTVRLSDGRRLTVPHPDFVSVSPVAASRNLVIHDEEDAPHRPHPRRRGWRAGPGRSTPAAKSKAGDNGA